MDKKNNSNKSKSIMALVFNIKKAKIKDNSSPDSIYLWDSIKHMDLILALEEEFKINFSNEEIGEMLNFKIIDPDHTADVNYFNLQNCKA